MTPYLWLKVAHVATAIVALGTSAGLGILLELYGDDERHGAWLLRAIHRLELLVVLPGYALMLATGVALVAQAWSFATPWIEAALLLWGVGLVLLVGSLLALRRQARAPTRANRLAARGLGAGAGLVVLGLVYLMVVKPAF